MKPLRLILVLSLLGLPSLLILTAEMGQQMITTLPPLFSGLEPNSTATLQMLIGETTVGTQTNRADANRIIRKDMIIEKSGEDAQGTGKWRLAKLTRYYQACLTVSERIELYTPAAEHKALLTDGEHYGAEWHVTLQTMAGSRWKYSDLPDSAKVSASLAGEARRLFAGLIPE